MKHADIQKLHDAGLCAASFLALAFLVSGCRTASVSAPLTSHPEAYRRVAILPVCFNSPFPTAFGDGVEDSETDRRAAGARLAFALTNQLAHKGYEVVGPVRVLCGENDWSQLDLTASSILRQQFDLERIRGDSGATNEFSYASGLTSSLPVLQNRLGLPEADAVLLVERWLGYDQPVFIPPPPAWVENTATLFEMAAPFFGAEPVYHGGASYPTGPAPSIHFSLYLFDARTREIIYWGHEAHGRKNPDSAARALLGPLPTIRE